MSTPFTVGDLVRYRRSDDTWVDAVVFGPSPGLLGLLDYGACVLTYLPKSHGVPVHRLAV
jgi:hypothetical protein